LGGAKGANYPLVIFLPKNRFLVTELKRGKQKMGIFSKQLFVWCRRKREEKNLRFTGCRIGI
jgi:hypothetical protein